MRACVCVCVKTMCCFYSLIATTQNDVTSGERRQSRRFHPVARDCRLTLEISRVQETSYYNPPVVFWKYKRRVNHVKTVEALYTIPEYEL